MISLSELNPRGLSLTQEQEQNSDELLYKINIVREVYGLPMIVTSGIRTKEDQIRIYKEKGITDTAKIPMGSCHLKAAAIDIADQNGNLMLWCKTNEKLISLIRLWIELGTSGWVHFQSIPYGSWVEGKTIFFNP
jgi:hypothetical protein